MDELTDKQIAEQLEIGLRTLGDWKANVEFRARVTSHIDEFRVRVRRRGIAIVENRVSHLQRRHDLMNQVIAQRAADPDMANVPGGPTGLMVHNVKSVGAGEFAERIDLYEVDTAILKELREHERQAAQELGQWLERSETSGLLNLQIDPRETIQALARDPQAYELAKSLASRLALADDPSKN